MHNKRIVFSTKWITYTAMLTALVVATGYIPALNLPVGNVYWVDGAVLLAAYLMDPLSAFIAGGVGSLIYDVLKSPSMMLPSLLIHGLQGALVSALLHCVLPRLFEKREWIRALICSVIGAVEVVSGYFLYRTVMYGLPVAVAAIARNVIQETIGVTIAMTVCYATSFKHRLVKSRLLPDFKAEMLARKGETCAASAENPEENAKIDRIPH